MNLKELGNVLIVLVGEEVLEYNDELRSQGLTVVPGHLHGETDQMHFVYTCGDKHHDLLIGFVPTDFTEWNKLHGWIDDNLI